jgi:hypothetical protein
MCYKGGPLGALCREEFFLQRDHMARTNGWINLDVICMYNTYIHTNTAGVGSLPMVFDLTTALWFNEYFVTADVAEPEDLET